MARVPGLFNIGSRWNKPRVVTTSVSTTFFFLTSYLTTSTVTNLMLQRCLGSFTYNWSIILLNYFIYLLFFPDLDQFATDKIIVQCSRRKRGDRQFLNPSKNIDKYILIGYRFIYKTAHCEWTYKFANRIEITRGFLESVDHNARGGYYQQNSNPNPINEESDPRYLDLLSSREIGTSPRSFYNSFRSDTPTLILTSLLTITIPTSYTFELSTFVQKVSNFIILYFNFSLVLLFITCWFLCCYAGNFTSEW